MCVECGIGRATISYLPTQNRLCSVTGMLIGFLRRSNVAVAPRGPVLVATPVYPQLEHVFRIHPVHAERPVLGQRSLEASAIHEQSFGSTALGREPAMRQPLLAAELVRPGA